MRTFLFSMLMTLALAGGVMAQTLYVTDPSGNTVYAVQQNGAQSTYLSGGLLAGPTVMALDASGNLYVANTTNNDIIKITPTMTASLFATMDGAIRDMNIDASGNLYVTQSNVVSKISAAGVITTVISGGLLDSPQGVVVDAAGNIFVANLQGSRELLKYDSNGSNGISLATNIGEAVGLAVDASGDVYASIFNTGEVLKFNGTTGTSQIFVSGLQAPTYMAFDGAGNFYVADLANGGEVRKYASDGTNGITITDAGGGGVAVPEPATWVMLALGGGLVAIAMRRLRSVNVFIPARLSRDHHQNEAGGG